jgi:hypothetical protein
MLHSAAEEAFTELSHGLRTVHLHPTGSELSQPREESGASDKQHPQWDERRCHGI